MHVSFPHEVTSQKAHLTLFPDPYFHPIVSAWISENTFDVKKRAITAATYNVIVQVGSLISSQIYRKYDVCLPILDPIHPSEVANTLT